MRNPRHYPLLRGQFAAALLTLAGFQFGYAATPEFPPCEAPGCNAVAKPSPMSALVSAELLFTKTPADREPEAAFAASVWAQILLSKSVIIGEGDVAVYRLGSLIVYRVTRENEQPTKADLVILDERKPNEFYRVGITSLPHAVVDKILAGLTGKPSHADKKSKV